MIIFSARLPTNHVATLHLAFLFDVWRLRLLWTIDLCYSHTLLSFDCFQKEARGSVTLKIVPSYRNPPAQCEVNQHSNVHVVGLVSRILSSNVASFTGPLWGASEINRPKIYCQISNIRRTKPQTLNVSHLVLQLSLSSPLKPGIKLRMKM